MKEKFWNPLFAVSVATAVLMILMFLGAIGSPDPLVINGFFPFSLLVIPVLATISLLFHQRRAGKGLSWGRMGLLWLGGNVLGLVVSVLLLIAFHTLVQPREDSAYNYNHFGFSSYLAGKERQVVEGGSAQDGVVYDLQGNAVQLSRLWQERPMVLEFGSITCPVFVGKVPSMNSLESQYQGKADFYVLYTREAHPGRNYGAHRNLEQKLQCAVDLREQEGVGRTILVDGVEGTLHGTYGAMPNSVYLIGTDGVVAHRADWLNPGVLKQRLDELLAAQGVGAHVPPSSLADNYIRVNPQAMATSLRVFWRAGLGSGVDFLLSFPAMVQGRLAAARRGDGSL